MASVGSEASCTPSQGEGATRYGTLSLLYAAQRPATTNGQWWVRAFCGKTLTSKFNWFKI
eukprot:scaffold7207_cov62-Phaeocystis_antarctica.AAC.6